LPEIDDVLEWLRKRGDVFINARRLAKAFKMSTKRAGYLLRKLKESGYLKVHCKRRGRFIVYKVNLNLLNKDKGVRGMLSLKKIRIKTTSTQEKRRKTFRIRGRKKTGKVRNQREHTRKLNLELRSSNSLGSQQS
jgi:DNA-binding protein